MKRLLSLLLIAAVCLSLVACGGKPNSGSTSADTSTNEPSTGGDYTDGGNLTVGTGEKTDETKYAEEVTLSLGLGKLDPHQGWNVQGEGYYRLVFDNLYYIDDITGEVTMELAKSVEWVDDTVTALKVVLRDDVVFSNGMPVTTEDVQFSLERTKYSNLKNYYDHCEIVSPTEMTIHLKQPYLNYYVMLNLSAAAIVCKAETEKHPDGQALIGSGPYVYDMDTYVIDSSITLKRNEKYWGETNATQKINIVRIAEASAATIALQNGEVDFIPTVNVTEIPNLQKDKNVEVYSFPCYTFLYMAFNDKCGNAMTEEEINFRRAVACAIDKEAIAIAIGGGMEKTSFWAYDNAAYIDSEAAFEHDLSYNPAKAKEYLAKAGGKTSFTCLLNSSSAETATAAQVVQEYLRQAGITMEIIEVDGTGFTAATKWGQMEYDALMHKNLWSTKVGGYSYFTPESGTNKAYMVNQTVVDAYTAAMGAADEAKQVELHQIILREVHKTQSYNPLCWIMANVGYNAGLENFTITSGNRLNFRDVCLRVN